ncbi:MAG TPA: MraY family glycosyltransferase [Isosphaeraceae bacterium]|jgi:UDP-GlcNAc:undecaprenyl-phosphate GlcNAc-1-phosphate transferase|nr:MraY family glycosyltransferase [Isosphaeraceae bacterium]
MLDNSYLLVFAVAFMGCVLTTPLVTRIAVWAGAIDRPDHFRRVHKGATPRMGGLGLAFGLVVSIVLAAAGGYLNSWDGFPDWLSRQWAVGLAGLIVLVVGAIDDSRGVRPRLKLLGQAVAVLVLYFGGIQIKNVAILGMTIELQYPSIAFTVLHTHVVVGLPSLFATLVWFLGCMNIWNLIDGMDGLASGVGLLVSATLMLIAIHQENMGAAIMAAALAGSLAGFLLYNWHPACIFLGDSGSMLIGLLVGVIGVQYSLKKSSAVSLLFPILAMGLPISDTAMAIFRRWVRNLPMTAADRRHVHHLLIGLGLDPRQAAVLLYCLTGFLCGVALLGVAFDREFLALVLGLSGCMAFLLILTSRRDELASLRADFLARFARRRQERFASRVTWEAIQKIELCDKLDGISAVLLETTRLLGCDSVRMSCYREGREVFKSTSAAADPGKSSHALSGPTATFRLSSGRDLMLAVELHQDSESFLAADIAFRFLQRLSLATAERLERLLASTGLFDPALDTFEAPTFDALKTTAVIADAESMATADGALTHATSSSGTAVGALAADVSSWDPLSWLRLAFGWETAPASAERTTPVGDD